MGYRYRRTPGRSTDRRQYADRAPVFARGARVLIPLVDRYSVATVERQSGEGALVVDDEDGKVRRNLVVGSAVLLLGTWLEVPAKVVADRLAGSSLDGHLSAGRLWFAVIVVLVYMALRYKFCGTVEAEGDRLAGTWKVRRIDAIMAILTRELDRWATLGASLRHFEPRLVEIEQSERRVNSADGFRLLRVELSRSGDLEFSGRVGLTFIWLNPDQDESATPRHATGGTSVSYSISRLKRLQIEMAAAAESFSYSKEAVEYLAPWVMFTLAYGLAVYRWASTWDWWLDLFGVR